MSEPAPLRVDDALDQLVHQFADPLSFYREVIQNALDAGSQEVEIYLTFEPSKDGGSQGMTIIHIDDWGEGMTREIITRQLTRLFSSAKDGDRTKIGKFGIGFVSVFAIDPELVCVDTSREGEHWRVLFTEDRRFELRRLEVPVDGTKIRIYKRTTRREHDDLRQRSREVIRYWCKHTNGEIRFADESMVEPFDITAPLKIRDEDDVSKIVIGHPRDGGSFYGFYNRGLTLIEGSDDHYPGLALKVSSDHLEHTLTRDNILQDAGYYRVLSRLEELVQGPLARAVFTAIDRALDPGGEVPDAHLRYLYGAAAWHLRERTSPTGRQVAGLRQEHEDSRIARSPSGAAITLRTLRRALASKELPLVAAGRSPLTDAVEAQGRLVLLASDDAPLHRFLAALSGHTLSAIGDEFCMPLPPRDDHEAARWQPLATAAWKLLSDLGGRLSDVEIAHFDYPESKIGGWVAITQRRFGALDPVAEVREIGSGLFSRRRTLVINADHPTVHSLVALAQREPEMAAYILAKLFYLGHRLDPGLDGDLTRLTLSTRDRRQATA